MSQVRRLGGLTLLLLLQCWLLSGFWQSVVDRTPASTYAAPTSAETWMASPSRGAHTFYRLNFGLDVLPQQAVLWTDADQFVTIYVNGFRVAEPVSAALNDVDTAPDLARRDVPFDVTAALKTGQDTIGVEVVNRAGRPAALRSELVLSEGGDDEVLGADPDDWLVTSNAAVTGDRLPNSGQFSLPTQDDSLWVRPTAVDTTYGFDRVDLPPAAYFLPVTGDQAVVGPAGGLPFVVRGSSRLPADARAVWLTVEASGPFTATLDGSVIAREDAVTGAFGDRSPLESKAVSSATPAVSYAYVFDLDGLARGRRTADVTIETLADRTATISARLSAQTGGGVDTLIGDTDWTVVEDGHPVAATTGVSAAPTAGQLRTEMVTGALLPNAATVDKLDGHLERWILIVLAATGMTAVGCLTQAGGARSVRRALGATVLGLGPASALALVFSQLRHFVDLAPPFPATPTALLALWVVAGVGAGLAVAGGRLAPITSSSEPALATGGSGREHDEGVDGPTGGRRRYRSAVLVLVGILIWVVGSDITFEPLWQDELSSLAAAQGMQHHILPRWPSGFLYWKSELYGTTIAIIGSLDHNNISQLREWTVVLYGLTVLAFGWYLAPLVLPTGRWLRLAATMVFATAPFELGHARDIRMYQMAQLLVVVVMVVFWKALRTNRRGTMWWAGVAVVAMYLAHEETFIILPVFPVMWLAFGPRDRSGLRRWLLPTGFAAGVIAVQLALAKLTHPAAFGSDASGGPLVKWTPAPFFYLDHFFFVDDAAGATITAMSLLAIVGITVGIWRRDRIRLYVAGYWVIPLVVVSTVLPAKDTRYCFVLLPAVFVLGFAGFSDLVGAVRRLVGPTVTGSLTGRILSVSMTGVAVVALMASLSGGLGDYGPMVAGWTHSDLSQREQDYDTADTWVKRQLEPGDVVVAGGTANLTGYGIGRPPNYWLGFRRGSRLLFTIEKNSEAVDTQYGVPVINNADQLDHVVNTSQRVWLVIGDSYVPGLLQGQITLLSTRFHLVYESEVVSVFEAAN